MNRTTLFSLAFAATSLLASNTSFALVSEVAQCEAKDGRYEILIEDNHGIGPERKSEPGAVIRDLENDRIVGSYPVTIKRGGSISFSGTHWVDSETGGHLFDLAGPSTNIRRISLEAKLASGKSLKDENLKCSVFGGVNE